MPAYLGGLYLLNKSARIWLLSATFTLALSPITTIAAEASILLQGQGGPATPGGGQGQGGPAAPGGGQGQGGPAGQGQGGPGGQSPWHRAQANLCQRRPTAGLQGWAIRPCSPVQTVLPCIK